ncbi:MFS transporter [Mesorhizobium sp. M2A.F.Ca.ET.037.01.1.1]|uniref:MFS transporter n=2 Tax=Mesorhizobium TaxID=68287 RepID=UPI000F757DD6|nr:MULTISPECIES: MFS transporter [unclassified Mesorhizobium]RVC65673.1 MFS transporter [Mesorhizobium sp. M2A.F.Ca.ET.046.02.1.1]AZO37876.1 MFS transporter [Mesorhizobium sp. M2A.F.Ca.ET.046.03.2.1]RUX04405.1 MFS transporter [Mesorhizobium sp. M2A.F.Ca.ET.037.01.1.1]RWA93846.1 MAG: MFS transporter [Mesorhizobium sp.]RWB48436.1 MAG: MFS transporter [Mesorhizobium sp.]
MRSIAQSAMRLWHNAERSRAMLPIMVGVCLACIGSAMLTTAVSLHLGKPGISPQVVQIVLTAYPVGFLVGCLVTRPAVAQYGHERTFVVILVLALLAASGFVFTDFLPSWICFRLLGGMAMASLFVVCESWINLYAEQHNRGALFSLYMLTTAIAVLLGQFLVGLVGPQSPHLFPVAAVTVLLALVSKFVGGRWPALPATDPGHAGSARPVKRLGPLALFRLAPVTVVAIFQGGITNMNIFVLTPIYGTQIGLSAATTVGLVTTISIAGMLAQTPVGWLSDRFERRIILLVQGILSVTLCAAIAWLGNSSVPLLFVLFFVYGCTALTVYPVAMAFGASQLHSRHMVGASGTLLLLYSIGNVATPGISAGLMQHMGAPAMFLLLGGGAVLVTLAACYNLLRRPVTMATMQAIEEQV